MLNLICEEGGVIKEIDLFWEMEIDGTFNMKIFR